MNSTSNQTNAVRPKVSVHMITYNHAKFVCEAIESVLMQKTDFPVELVIGEDGSTDGTREICIEYARKYPDRIRLLLRERTEPERKNFAAPWGHNSSETHKACRGEYIAFLEGDDFWTDPLKLAKQVALLDAKPEIAFCFHRVTVFHEPNGKEDYDYPPPEHRKALFTHLELIRGCYITTCSVLFRLSARPVLDAAFYKLPVSDWPLFVLLTRHGSAAYQDEVMAKYRKHSGGAWSSKPKSDRYIAQIKVLEYLLPLVQPNARRQTRLKLGHRHYVLAAHHAETGARSPAFRHAFRSLFCSIISADSAVTQPALLILDLTVPPLARGLRSMRQTFRKRKVA